jgi:hypothetical protein
MSNAPSESYQQHHDVAEPRVDALAFRQGWRSRRGSMACSSRARSTRRHSRPPTASGATGNTATGSGRPGCCRRAAAAARGKARSTGSPRWAGCAGSPRRFPPSISSWSSNAPCSTCRGRRSAAHTGLPRRRRNAGRSPRSAGLPSSPPNAHAVSQAPRHRGFDRLPYRSSWPEATTARSR